MSIFGVFFEVVCLPWFLSLQDDDIRSCFILYVFDQIVCGKRITGFYNTHLITNVKWFQNVCSVKKKPMLNVLALPFLYPAVI